MIMKFYSTCVGVTLMIPSSNVPIFSSPLSFCSTNKNWRFPISSKYLLQKVSKALLTGLPVFKVNLSDFCIATLLITNCVRSLFFFTLPALFFILLESMTAAASTFFSIPFPYSQSSVDYSTFSVFTTVSDSITLLSAHPNPPFPLASSPKDVPKHDQIQQAPVFLP